MLKILCVEDNDDDAKLMHDYMAESGYKFEWLRARTLNEAMSISQNPATRPHVVFMDLNLPDSFGEDGVKKYHMVFEAVPVIVVSGAYNDKMDARVRAAGAFRFFEKDKLRPVNLLYEAVKDAVAWTNLRGISPGGST